MESQVKTLLAILKFFLPNLSFQFNRCEYFEIIKIAVDLIFLTSG